MNTRTLIGVSLAVLVLGLALGLVPGSAMGATNSFSCGSPWVRDTESISRQNHIDGLSDALSGGSGTVTTTKYAQRCDDELDTRGIVAGVLAGLAALTLIGVAVVRRPETSERGN